MFAAMPTGKRRRKTWLPASQFVKAEYRVSDDDYRARLQELEQRDRADNRTPAQRWLGDPDPTRSALANRSPPADKKRGRRWRPFC
jgi:hypothetical protein